MRILGADQGDLINTGVFMIWVYYLGLVSATSRACVVLVTSLSGDYQTHDFSDFEDSDDGGRDRRADAKGGSSVVRKSGGKRLKECPGCSAMLPLPTKECDYCDYVFTSRSMLSTAQNAVVESQNIRDIFPFEPERVGTYLFFFSFHSCPNACRGLSDRRRTGPIRSRAS
jgi:hypothetical protein